MTMHEQHTWLSGRAMLMSEIAARVRALRVVIDRRGEANGFRTGLVLFLERRLDHLREVLAVVQDSPSAAAQRQSLDRMIAAIVGTLRHVELEISVDRGCESESRPTPASDRRMVSTGRADSIGMTHRAVAHHEGR
jgi:hypothetical protein